MEHHPLNAHMPEEAAAVSDKAQPHQLELWQ
jgi:hypothetical protein